MQINRVNNTPSFGMAWDKGAKKTLAKIVKKLPAEKAEEAIQKINWLEANSPHHKLSISTMFNEITAVRTNSDMYKSRDFSFGNFIRFFTQGKRKDKASVLQEVVDYIQSENARIPKIEESQKRIFPKLSRIIKNGLGGWYDYDETKLAGKISWLIAEIANDRGGAKKANELIKQIERIGKKAASWNLEIRRDYFSSRLYVTKIYGAFGEQSDDIKMNPLPKALDKIETIIDKEILKKRLSMAESPVIAAKGKILDLKSTIRNAKESIHWERRALKKAKKEAAAKKKEIRREVFGQTRLGHLVDGFKARFNGVREFIKSKFTSKKLTAEYIESQLKIADEAEKTAK